MDGPARRDKLGACPAYAGIRSYLLRFARKSLVFMGTSSFHLTIVVITKLIPDLFGCRGRILFGETYCRMEDSCVTIDLIKWVAVIAALLVIALSLMAAP